MSVTEVHGALGLDKLKNRTFQIFKVSGYWDSSGCLQFSLLIDLTILKSMKILMPWNEMLLLFGPSFAPRKPTIVSIFLNKSRKSVRLNKTGLNSFLLLVFYKIKRFAMSIMLTIYCCTKILASVDADYFKHTKISIYINSYITYIMCFYY